MVEFLDISLSKCALVGHPLLFQRVVGHFEDEIDCWIWSLLPGPIFSELFSHFGKFLAIVGYTRNRSCRKTPLCITFFPVMNTPIIVTKIKVKFGINNNVWSCMHVNISREILKRNVNHISASIETQLSMLLICIMTLYH